MNIHPLGASEPRHFLTERADLRPQRHGVLATSRKHSLAKPVHVIQGSTIRPRFRGNPSRCRQRSSCHGAKLSQERGCSRARCEQIIAAIRRASPSQTRTPHRRYRFGRGLSCFARQTAGMARWIVQNIVYTHVPQVALASQVSHWNNLSPATLDWKMVMTPMLTNSPPVAANRIRWRRAPPNGRRIYRADVRRLHEQQIDTRQ